MIALIWLQVSAGWMSRVKAFIFLLLFFFVSFGSGCVSTRQFAPLPAEGKCPENKVRIHVHRPGPFMPQIGFDVYDKAKLVGRIGVGGDLLWERTPGLVCLRVDQETRNLLLNDKIFCFFEATGGGQYDFNLAYSFSTGMSIVPTGMNKVLPLITRCLVCPPIDKRENKSIGLRVDTKEHRYMTSGTLLKSMRFMGYLDGIEADDKSYHGVTYEALLSGGVNTNAFATDLTYALVPVVKELCYSGPATKTEIELFVVNTRTGCILRKSSAQFSRFIGLLNWGGLLASGEAEVDFERVGNEALRRMPVLEPYGATPCLQ